MSADKNEVFVVMTIARQIQGEYLFAKADGAFRDPAKAEELLKKLAKDYTDDQGKAKPVKVSSPNGEAVCFCEIGAFRLEIQ